MTDPERTDSPEVHMPGLAEQELTIGNFIRTLEVDGHRRYWFRLQMAAKDAECWNDLKARLIETIRGMA